MESLLQDQEDYAARRGDIRMGRIIEITAEGALVDIGLKQEGFVSARDLQQLERAQMGEIQAGAQVPVKIINTQDADGYLEVSIYQARMEEDWLTAEELLKSGDVYEAQIAGQNRGGLIVHFGRIRGFIPMSHIVGLRRDMGEPERRRHLEAMVGQTVGLRVIEVDQQRKRLILSQRQAYRTWRRMQRRRLLEELEEGQRRSGIVSSITDFGAFVDLGGVDGLVHLSELSWQRVAHPREAVQVGDEVEVVVLTVDRVKGRIGLSIRQASEDPWKGVEERYQVNQLVEGRVTRVTDLGAFVEVEPGIEGLLHVSELIGSPSVTPQEVLKADDVVLLKILRVEGSRRRLGLSARRVRREEWERWAVDKAAREAEKGSAGETEEEPQATVEPIEDGAGPALDPAAEAAPESDMPDDLDVSEPPADEELLEDEASPEEEASEDEEDMGLAE